VREHEGLMGERSTFVTTWSSEHADAEHLRDYFLANNPFASVSVVQGPGSEIWFVAGWLKSGPAPHVEYDNLVDEPYAPREGAKWYGAPYITILCDGGPDSIVGSLIRRDYVVRRHDDMLNKDPESFGAAVV